MNEVCGVHQLPWKVIPAGISSKTGKPYREFRVCPVKDCPERPNRLSDPENITAPRPSQVVEHIDPVKAIDTPKEVDWDAKERISIKQTSWNSVAVITAAMMGMGTTVQWPEIEAMVNSVYDDILSVKKGE